MHGFMPPGPGTAAVFLGGGVPKDFIQIAATSVSTLRGTGEASPHMAAIQITTDNAVYGGLGGASVASECLAWGKESPDGDNVMVFADVTIALPLLCQGLLERYGEKHVRPARATIAAALRRSWPGRTRSIRSEGVAEQNADHHGERDQPGGLCIGLDAGKSPMPLQAQSAGKSNQPALAAS